MFTILMSAALAILGWLNIFGVTHIHVGQSTMLGLVFIIAANVLMHAERL